MTRTAKTLTALALVALVPIVGVQASSARSGTTASAAPLKQRNALGVVIVDFTKGTPASAMKAAVAAAGGMVTSDLSKIGRLGAVSTSSTFAGKLRANASVAAVFSDRVWRATPTDTASGTTGNNTPALGNGPAGPPDPWHNLPSFLGETNPEGILQWDDNRMDVPAAWDAGYQGAGVKVAVIDSGVQGSHKEILPNYDNQTSANTIPCSTLVKAYGAATVKAYGMLDCSSEDTDGHGTWVAGRIVGAANGFASNGIAPQATVAGFKALATGFGGLTSWITDAMIRACDAGYDLINMSLGGYDDPFDLANPYAVYDALDLAVWKDAVDYCRSKGTAVVAAAGNEHVRVNRTNEIVDYSVYDVDGLSGTLTLNGVGRVDSGDEGIETIIPGTTPGKYVTDLKGMIEVPAGIPGVIMVSATNNAVSDAVNTSPFTWAANVPSVVGARDQLTYYSNYGSRVDIAAPGGARKFNVPRYDIGSADILYGGWGELGPIDPSGDLCATAGSLLTFACFTVSGAGFAWLQGTSMATPSAVGVAALTLSAHPELRGDPDALLAHLQATARTDMVNHMVPNDPANTADSVTAGPCPTGWCHLAYGDSPISFTDAYGAGIVDAGNAVS